jgi:hypothetical protein
MTRWLLILSVSLMLPGRLCAQPAVDRLEIFPTERTLHAPGRTQQLAVRAHYADGSQRDVTRLTLFTSTDAEIATVNSDGLVRFHQPGEVAILCRYRTLGTARLAYVEPRPGFTWPDPPEDNFIDRLVFAQLKRLHVAPSELSPDEVFVRRAYLDACGILPTPAEVRKFLDDKNPAKRARLIDALLERPEFAECWAHHWVEILHLHNAHLGTKSGMAYLHWIRGQLRNDTPLDRLVREMLLGKGPVTDEGPVHFYQTGNNPTEWAERTAAAFLGVRMQCVRCHESIDSRWKTADARQFSAFFAQLSRHRVDARPGPIYLMMLDRQAEWLDPATKKPVPPRFPDGTAPKLTPGQDRREPLADWLTARENPYFARTMANRIWYHLLGKGIADPPDVIHELPLTANDALLDALAKKLVARRFELKPMVRLIMNSRTYQLSAKTNEFNKDDQKYFSHAYAGRMSEALLIDAVAQVLELPPWIEGIEKMPAGTRAVHYVHPGPRFWAGGGRVRSDCERDAADSHSPQVAFVHMINSEEFQARLKVPYTRANRLLSENRTDREIIDDIFLAAFARLPSDENRQKAREHFAKTKDRAQACEDILWAVLNSREFIQRR